MKWIRWFVAGALAVPLCHQVMLAILHAIGWIDRAPFSFAPTKPFGVPQLISLSFWGGVWGLILGLVLLRAHTPRVYWMIAVIFGAIAPTLVAGFVVAPLKGQPAGGNAKLALVGLLVNGAWAAGTAALYKVMARSRASR